MHTESGPFISELLADPHRWADDGLLSIPVQDTPAEPHEPAPLRILDFAVTR